MKRLKMILVLGVLCSIMACKRSNTNRYPANEECHNLNLSISQLHPHERVALLYDTRLVLRHRVDSVHDIDLNKDFCIKYRDKGTLRLIIWANKKALIDTSILIERPNSGYKLMVSRPQMAITLTPDITADNL
ncbi:MAG: hypothetical protein JO080_10145 [Mucilaginibacter sp.]|nr:hypothetical protein [Mucilaginibacter sp.]